jgi:crotonobetainyl-CoA:carnitine CoA-transferase CaiB-like acyl-CoA transferase
MLAVGNDRQFADCMRCCNLSELADDPRFRRNEDRLANRDELIARIGAAMERESSDHWLRSLAEGGVPCGPICDIGDVFSGSYAAECELVRTLPHAYDEGLPTVASPVRFSTGKITYRLAPPLLGEHTEQVLADWLGYSEDTISRLKKAGTI